MKLLDDIRDKFAGNPLLPFVEKLFEQNEELKVLCDEYLEVKKRVNDWLSSKDKDKIKFGAEIASIYMKMPAATIELISREEYKLLLKECLEEIKKFTP